MKRSPAVDVGDVDQRDLIPLSNLLTPPRSPRLPVALLAVLGLALVFVPFAGLGRVGPDEPLAEGRILVQGRDLASTDEVAADLAEPIEVRIGGNVPAAALVSVDTAVAGISAGTSSIEELGEGPDGRSASVTASSLRRVASGDLPAELRVTTEDGEPLLTRRFTIEQQEPQLLNGATITAAAVTLFVAVYFASITRPLRLGRRRRSAYPGLVPIGAFGGVGVSLWEWALAGPAPTSVSLAVAAILGAAAAPLSGWCLFVRGRRRRLRKSVTV